MLIEEGDETVFWLELLMDSGVVKRERMTGLLAEANESLAIFSTLLQNSQVAGQMTCNSYCLISSVEDGCR
jgi:hypothetical protein